MNESSRILITGASGFTGRHACKYFSRRGYQVIAAIHQKPLDITEGLNIQEITCDLMEENQIRYMIQQTKPDYVLHLAGQNHVYTSWIDPVKTIKINFLSTLYLLEAIRDVLPASKIVLIGSALQNLQTNPFSASHPYGLSKTYQTYLGKAWTDLYKLNIVVARTANLIGPGPSKGVCSIFAKKIAEMEYGMKTSPPQVDDAYAQRDFLDVRDAVRAYEVLLQKGEPGKEYGIGSGKSRSIAELLSCFQRLTNIPLPKYSNDKKHQEFNIDINAILQLGWKPEIIFIDSLRDVLEYFRLLVKQEEG